MVFIVRSELTRREWYSLLDLTHPPLMPEARLRQRVPLRGGDLVSGGVVVDPLFDRVDDHYHLLADLWFGEAEKIDT